MVVLDVEDFKRINYQITSNQEVGLSRVSTWTCLEPGGVMEKVAVLLHKNLI
jgi:hypothetical protein